MTEDNEGALADVYANYEKISAYLGDKDFMLGSHVTLPDILMWDALQYFNDLSEGTFFEKYPNLGALANRVGELPEIKSYHESDRFKGGSYNGPSLKESQA